MEPEKPPPLRVTATRLARAVAVFANSEAGWKAKWLFVALLVLLLAANGLTVVNSFVGRNFMTAIADRREAEFVRLAIFYVGVFAASTMTRRNVNSAPAAAAAITRMTSSSSTSSLSPQVSQIMSMP